MKLHLFTIVIIILLFSIGAVHGIEDAFSNHESDDLELPYPVWDITKTNGGYTDIITGEIETYNKCLHFRTYVDSTTILASTEYENSEYVSFVGLRYTDNAHGPHNMYLALYDADGVILPATYNLRPAFLDPGDNNLIEIVIDSGVVYQYTNGVYMRNLGLCSVTPYYYSFWAVIPGGSSYYGSRYYIDSASNDGFVIGISTSESPEIWVNIASNDEIDIEWTVKTIDPYGTWNDSTYQIVTTWLDGGNQVVNTTTLNDSKPCGFIIYNRSDLMGTNYGAYKFELTKDGTVMETEYLTFNPIGESGSLSWEKSDYVQMETAVVDYVYSFYTPSTHNYYIKTYNINTGLVDTHTLSAISGTENILIGSDWDIGSYYSLLIVQEKSSSEEYSLAFDVFDVNDIVVMNGTTYDVTNGTALGSTDVNFSQSLAWYNTTSDINGTYTLNGLSVDIQVLANASKTGFYHEYFLFTPVISGFQEMDLYLFPNNITRYTHAVEGVIIDDAMHQAIPGAIVNIWNSTWNNNTTANSLGYYRFDNLWCNSTGIIDEIFDTGNYGTWTQLNHSKIIIGSQEVTNISTSFVYFNNTDYLMNYTDGTIQTNASGNMTANNDTYINYSYYLPTTYYVNATADGHDDSIDYTAIVNSWTVQNIPLRAIYSLVITAVDSTTGATLQEFTVVVDTESRDIINGTTTYYKNFGLYTITVTSDGYYSAEENVMMDRNRNVQLSLAPVDSEYYMAHYVEFIVCSIWGTKYPDVSVSVYNSTDTTGDTLLNGTTGVDGGVTFRMNQDVRYTMTFIGGGITEKTVNLYPKNEHYYIIVSYTGDTFDDDTLESNIIGVDVKHYPGVNGSVDVSYNDISDETTALNFTIKERELMGNFTTIATYDSFANMSDGDHRFILTGYADKEYIVIVNYTHSEYGDRQRNFGLSYGNNIAVLNAIFGPFIKGMLSVFILICVGLIFGAANRETGALLVSLTAAILHSMHWFDYFGMNTIILWAAISLALIVSISASFSKKSKEEGY